MNTFYFKNNNNLFYYLHDSNIDLSTVLEIKKEENPHYKTIDIGPHLNLNTAFSSNVLNIFNRINIHDITKFELIKVK